MRLFLLLFLGSLSSFAFSQAPKDLTLSFSAGSVNSPYYDRARANLFLGFDFDYHLSRKSILSMGYFSGNHYYFDDVLSNAPYDFLYSNGTNAKAFYRTVSVLYKYKAINNRRFYLTAGVGAGILTHEQRYWYRRGNSAGPETSSFSDLAFPVKLDAGVKLSRRFELGLTSGFLIEPDYPFLAFHGGTKLSYTLR